MPPRPDVQTIAQSRSRRLPLHPGRRPWHGMPLAAAAVLLPATPWLHEGAPPHPAPGLAGLVFRVDVVPRVPPVRPPRHQPAAEVDPVGRADLGDETARSTTSQLTLTPAMSASRAARDIVPHAICWPRHQKVRGADAVQPDHLLCEPLVSPSMTLVAAGEWIGTAPEGQNGDCDRSRARPSIWLPSLPDQWQSIGGLCFVCRPA